MTSIYPRQAGSCSHSDPHLHVCSPNPSGSWLGGPNLTLFIQPSFPMNLGPDEGDIVPTLRKPQDVFTMLGGRRAIHQASPNRSQDDQRVIQPLTTIKETQMKAGRDNISTY